MADRDVNGDRNYRDADEKLADAVTAFNADEDINFVMMIGDYVDGYVEVDEAQTLIDLAQIEAVYDNLTADRYYVLGNHDPKSISKAQFIANTGMSSGYYSFDAGDLHVIVLDGCFATDDDEDPYVPGGSQWGADAMYVPPNERTWLTNDLAGTSKETIVFMHFRLDAGSSSYRLTNYAAVMAILEASGKVRHVFAGHNHICTHLQMYGIGYHNMEAMTENAYPENAYSIVKVYDNGWVVVTGTDRQDSYSYQVPIC